MDFDINTDYALGDYQGDSRKALNYYIILHESGNDNDRNDPNAILHEVQYMHNNYQSAYVQYFVGGGGKIYQIGEPGYVSWGALEANPYAPIQIELARTSDPETFRKDYETYISLARYYASIYDIPLTLDEGGRGIKTHNWVTNNYGGDHVDPYGYFASWGITKDQLKNDIENGIDGTDKPEIKRDVITINYISGYGVLAYNQYGDSIVDSNKTFLHGTAWKSAGIKLINNEPMYQVATGMFIPKKYTDQKNIVTVNSIAGVNAFTKDGVKLEGTDKTFTDLSKWATIDEHMATINKTLMFEVATNQYIDAFYTIGGGNK